MKNKINKLKYFYNEILEENLDVKKWPLRVKGTSGATYDSVIQDLKRFGDDFKSHIARAATNGMIIVYPNGKYNAIGHVPYPIDWNKTISTGIDRGLG